MNDIKQEFTPEEIAERAKENSKTYWDAREREEQEIHRPHKTN